MANDDHNQQQAVYEGLASEAPSALTVSFASDPAASLGVQLSHHDNGLTNELFLPGYASVGRLLDGPTPATEKGVRVGDVLVAVSGEGFRRFPPDFPPEFEDATAEDATAGRDRLQPSEASEGDADPFAWGTEQEGAAPTDEETARRRELQGRVVKGKRSGEAYERLLLKIRDTRTARTQDPANAVPLAISFERYGWDSRVHAWSRFLSARRGIVPEAMTMIQGHGRWRSDFFPIDLTAPSLQRLLRARAVSAVDPAPDAGGAEGDARPAPAVCIDVAVLRALSGLESPGPEAREALPADVVRAFVLFTDTVLSEAPDPRRPRISQFVDLTGVSLAKGLHPGLLKKLYATFEPNYPETLEKMVLYPVPRLMVRAVNAMLSFVNQHTRDKFIITDDLVVVCKELGWNLKDVETCGSVHGYVKKHARRAFVVD